MASSFGGVTIFPLPDGVRRQTALTYTERQISGSDLTVIDKSGKVLRHLHLTLLFEDGGDALAFESLVGEQGSLVMFDGTYDALLVALERTSRGVTVQGPTELSAEFVLLSSSTEDDLILVEE